MILLFFQVSALLERSFPWICSQALHKITKVR